MENSYDSSNQIQKTEPKKYQESESHIRKPFMNVENPINRIHGYNKTDISDSFEPSFLDLEM